MKLVKTVIEVEVYDQKFNLRKPNFKESQQYRENLLKIGADGDAALIMQSFLELLGLPAGLFETLEFEHITSLMEIVTSSKKN